MSQFMTTSAADAEVLKHLGNTNEVANFLQKYSPHTKKALARKLCARSTEENFEPRVLFTQFIAVVASCHSGSEFAQYKKSLALQDISEEDLMAVAYDLNHTTLSPAAEPIPYPVRGIVFGHANRTFITLSVKPNGEAGPHIHVNFLYNNGSPVTHLRRTTLDALFPNTEPKVQVARVNINGLQVPITVSLSTEEYDNIDLLGQDFMTAGQFTWMCNFKTGEASLSSS